MICSKLPKPKPNATGTSDLSSNCITNQNINTLAVVHRVDKCGIWCQNAKHGWSRTTQIRHPKKTESQERVNVDMRNANMWKGCKKISWLSLNAIWLSPMFSVKVRASLGAQHKRSGSKISYNCKPRNPLQCVSVQKLTFFMLKRVFYHLKLELQSKKFFILAYHNKKISCYVPLKNCILAYYNQKISLYVLLWKLAFLQTKRFSAENWQLHTMQNSGY